MLLRSVDGLFLRGSLISQPIDGRSRLPKPLLQIGKVGIRLAQMLEVLLPYADPLAETRPLRLFGQLRSQLPALLLQALMLGLPGRRQLRAELAGAPQAAGDPLASIALLLAVFP
ncbi:hypothetical protein D3C80_1633180 [compost metagenome]